MKFADPAREAEGFVALAKRTKVICFADNTYEIAKSSLTILEEIGLLGEVFVEELFDGGPSPGTRI
jgi:hypothetical protein